MKHSLMIVLSALALRLLFLIATPAADNSDTFRLSAFNDEKAHYQYVLRMAEEGVRPIQVHKVNESLARGIHEFEYYQSPLWYKLAASIYKALPSPLKNLHSIRFLNLIIGLALIPVIGSIVELYDSRLKSAAMVFSAILPSAVFFSSVVTNDNLFWLTSALTIYYGTALCLKSTVKNRLGMVLAFAAAVWTKMSALTLLPGLLFVLIASYRRKPTMIKVPVSLAWLILPLLLTAPLFRQNYLYYGSFIPLSAGTEAHNLLTGLAPKNLYLTANYLAHTFFFPFENFYYGVYQAGLIFVLAAAVLVLTALVLKRFAADFARGSGENRRIQVFYGLTLIFMLTGLAYMILRYHQAEARLVFGALPVVALIIAGGLDKALGKHRNYTTLAAALLGALPYTIFLIH